MSIAKGKGLKIGVIGAGSTYTPELIEGFITRREQLSISQIVLMDIDRERLAIVGGLARRMIERAGLKTEVNLTSERRPAIEEADFLISQFRVGMLAGRARDEKIPLEFGIIGQETTGPGGFAMALRTIPVILDIAHEMELLSPNGWFINFTNPCGLISEALHRHTRVRAIGLCNGPITLRLRIASLFGVDGMSVWLDYFGLNHLSWVRHVYVNGQDVIDTLIKEIVEGKAADLPGFVFNKSLLEALHMIPSGYLQYYYHADRVLENMRQSEMTRAGRVMRIEQELLELYRNPDLREKPKALEQRGGAGYSEAAASLLSAIVKDKNEVHIVNVPNQAAMEALPDKAVVEVPALVNCAGAHPLIVGEIPVAVRGIIQEVKAYEELTVEAAVTGSRKTALLALLSHPLVPTVDIAEKLLERILDANREFLPQFKAG